MPTRRTLLAAAAALPAGRGFAQSGSPKTLRIGVLNDQSSLYADMGGPGSVIAARLAIADADLAAKGWTAELLVTDHQNKPDIASAIARRWFDDGQHYLSDYYAYEATIPAEEAFRPLSEGGCKLVKS